MRRIPKTFLGDAGLSQYGRREDLGKGPQPDGELHSSYPHGVDRNTSPDT
jgi:hypothetical protein